MTKANRPAGAAPAYGTGREEARQSSAAHSADRRERTWIIVLSPLGRRRVVHLYTAIRGGTQPRGQPVGSGQNFGGPGREGALGRARRRPRRAPGGASSASPP